VKESPTRFALLRRGGFGEREFVKLKVLFLQVVNTLHKRSNNAEWTAPNSLWDVEDLHESMNVVVLRTN
jgi:hypothetical protein